MPEFNAPMVPVAAALILVLASAFPQAEVRLALAGNDPVEAIAGKAVPGQATIRVDHGVFTYRFANHENMAKFRRDPGRYAFQWGGACGSMGPLTGRGTGELFSVYQGKLWTFASPQCKAKFDKDPAAHAANIELPAPQSGPSDRDVAAELHRRVVAAHRAAGIRGGTWEYKTTYEGYGDYFDTFTVLPEYVSFATGKRGEQYIHRTGRGGFYQEPKRRSVPIDAVEASELEAKIRATPLGVLASKAEPFAVVADASIPGLDAKLRAYTIGPARLFIDGTDRIVAIETSERVRGVPAKVMRRYSDFANVDGVILPRASEVWSDGKWNAPTRLDRVSVVR